jgi:hypothetical protein
MNQLPFISVTPSVRLPRLPIWLSSRGRFMCSAALPLRSYTPDELWHAGKKPAGKVFDPQRVHSPPPQPAVFWLDAAQTPAW